MRPMNDSHESLSTREKALVERLARTQKSVFGRFPLIFTLLGAFGAAGTFAGLNGIIEKIPFLSNNPIVLLVVGLLILAITGKLYQKLG